MGFVGNVGGTPICKYKATKNVTVNLAIGRNLTATDKVNTPIMDIREIQAEKSINPSKWQDNANSLAEETLKLRSQINQLADSISLKSSKYELNDLMESVKNVEMKLTPKGVSVIIKDSGGCNLLKNSIFKNGEKYWSKTNNGNIVGLARGQQIYGKLGVDTYIYQKITDIPQNTNIISVSGEFASFEYKKGSSSTITGVRVGINLEDGTTVYNNIIQVDETTGYAWKYLTGTIKTESPIREVFLYFRGRYFEGKIYCRNLMCNVGIIPQQWSQAPNEVYDGITTIDRDGITVINGGLTIKNNNDQVVLQGDTNGNLDLISRDVNKSISFSKGSIIEFDGNRKSVAIENNMISLYDFSRSGDWCSSYASQSNDSGFGSGVITARAASFYNLLSLHQGSDLSIPYLRFRKSENDLILYNMAAFNLNKTPLENVEKINYNTEDKRVWLGKMILYNNTIDTNAGTNKLWLNYWRGSGTGTSTVHVCDGANNGTGGKLTAGSLAVTGSKNCVVNTREHGNLLINAYETTDYYFGDIGSGKLENRECYIYIDEIFQSVVNSKYKYQVFLTKYGQGDIWVDERTENYFIVKGTNDIEFGFEIKAKRKGYENDRLEKDDNNRDILNDHGFNNNSTNEMNEINSEIEKVINEEFISQSELKEYAFEDNLNFSLQELKKEEERILYNNLMFKGDNNE